MKTGILLLLIFTISVPYSAEGFSFVSLRGDSHTKPVKIVVVEGQKVIVGNTLRNDISGHNGGWDIFLFYVNTGAWRLVGGGGHDEATDAVVYGSSIYITGSTTSSEFGSNGIKDALVIKITGEETEWVHGFGGSGEERGNTISADNTGVYLGGSTTSQGIGEYSTYQGKRDAFISSFSHTGERIFFEYVGGSDFDLISGIYAWSNSLFVFGTTGSTDLMVSNGFQTEMSGGEIDSFVGKYTKSGELQQLSYFGQFGSDVAKSIIGDGDFIYFIGQTSSWFLPGQQLLLNYTDPRFNVFIAKSDGNLSTEPLKTAILGGDRVDLVEFGFIQDDVIYLSGSSRSDNIEFTDLFPWEGETLQKSVVFELNLSLLWVRTHAFSQGWSIMGKDLYADSQLHLLVLGTASTCNCIQTILVSADLSSNEEIFQTPLAYVLTLTSVIILMLLRSRRLRKRKGNIVIHT